MTKKLLLARVVREPVAGAGIVSLLRFSRRHQCFHLCQSFRSIIDGAVDLGLQIIVWNAHKLLQHDPANQVLIEPVFQCAGLVADLLLACRPGRPMLRNVVIQLLDQLRLLLGSLFRDTGWPAESCSPASVAGCPPRCWCPRTPP